MSAAVSDHNLELEAALAWIEADPHDRDAFRSFLALVKATDPDEHWVSDRGGTLTA